MGLLDQIRYPFDDPDGRKLLDDLADLHDPRKARSLSQRAGLPIASINFQGSARDVWPDILDIAAKCGKLRALAQVISEDTESLGVHGLLERLLADGPDLVPPEAQRGDKTLPARAVLPMKSSWSMATTLAGHRGGVRGLAFSPDGALLASAGDDRVLLWDMGTGKSRSLTGHSDAVSGVAFSPDGHLLASASADQTIRLWNIPAGMVRRILRGHSGRVSSVAFSPPHGTLLASADWVDQVVRLWNVVGGGTASILSGHQGWVLGVAFSPDGHLLASASADQTIRLWEVSTGSALAALTGHTGLVTCVAFSPDGARLASGGGTDHKVQIWTKFADGPD